jgi:hypothetical protein
MTKMIKVLSIVTILFTSASIMAVEKSPSRLNQVRNSLWVFGVDNGVSHVPTDIEHVMMNEQDSNVQEEMVVPEELQMAILKIDA